MQDRNSMRLRYGLACLLFVASTVFFSACDGFQRQLPDTVEIVPSPPISVPGTTLTDQLSWLRRHGQSGNHYIVEIGGDTIITATNAALPTGRNITFRGTVPSRITGTFTVPPGVTLTLDQNVTITGNSRGVTVQNGGRLIMNAGARITGNVVSSSVTGGDVTTGGGGVFVSGGGTFTMNGGEISGNTVTANRTGGTSGNITAQGGGVFVSSGGTFTMNGGEISGNTVTANRTATGNQQGSVTAEGGGVFVSSSSTFTMNGGEISGNTVTASRSVTVGTLVSRGGGVHVAGIFRISNGIVRGDESAEAEELRNTSGDGLSASLSNAGTAQRGTFSGGTFTSLGFLNTTNFTINVLNGNLR